VRDAAGEVTINLGAVLAESVVELPYLTIGLQLPQVPARRGDQRMVPVATSGSPEHQLRGAGKLAELQAQIE
jgi:hypothetical protein